MALPSASGRLVPPRDWLLKYYWAFAWGMVVFALPLYGLLGQTFDGVVLAGSVLLTLVGWAYARYRSADIGITVHVVGMFPLWTWYVMHADGMPQRLDAGAAGHMVLLTFPTVALIGLWGRWGAIASIAMGMMAVLVAWDAPAAWLIGLYLLAISVAIGSIFRRLMVQLGRVQEQLQEKTQRDELTNLPNRRALEAAAESFTRADARAPAALLYLDLDRFKAINDSLGHAMGDHVLEQVANRLSAATYPGELLVRLGGDEFAVVVPSTTGPGGAGDVADRMLLALREPFEAGAHHFHIGASVGIALCPIHGRELDGLMRCADIAMYRAKIEGRTWEVYQPEFPVYTVDRLELRDELQIAIQNDELELYYQAITNITTDSVVGYEALLRWNHPKRGLLLPAEFLPLADEAAQIGALDRWVLGRAVRQARDWEQEGRNVWIAVNLSARSVEDHSFIGFVAGAVHGAELSAGRLIVEVTESSVVRNPENTSRLLAGLKPHGVAVALDDFGTGYSSLAYVKQLPVDHLKLDRSFVQGIGVDPRDERLVEVILQLAQGLGLSVIAEGVETRAQKEWLRAKGCVFVQGFLLGRPRPLRDLDRKPGSTPPPPGVMPVDSDPAPAVSHNSELLAARRSRNSLS